MPMTKKKNLDYFYFKHSVYVWETPGGPQTEAGGHCIWLILLLIKFV